MKLEELLRSANDEVTVKVFDKEDKILATYDGKDSIPVALNCVEVDEFTVGAYRALEVKLDFIDNTKAVDYLKTCLDDIIEDIATDEGFRWSSPADINNYIEERLDDVDKKIRFIQMNLSNGYDWNYLL